MSVRVKVRTENRFYLENGHLIQRIRSQFPPHSGNDLASFNPDVTDLLATAKLFVACASVGSDTCDKTGAGVLANILNSAVVSKSDRYLCAGDDGEHHFSERPETHCTLVSLEGSWTRYLSNRAVVIDIMPSSLVREPDGVKIWTKFFLAQPAPGESGLWRYDYTKAVYKFYCRSKQQLLIQGTYALKGNVVYERSSKESVIEEIEPGTFSDHLYEYVCAKKLAP
jgi:hypothetical protein